MSSHPTNEPILGYEPGSTEKEVNFGKLCKTGGVVNVYNAVLLAEKKSK